MINKKYSNLINNFNLISQKKWIKSIVNNTSGVGLTFESLLGKLPDSMFFPDYYGIEIKCTTRFSRYPITLFTKAFDGPSLYEMNKILEKYGKTDMIYIDRKLLLCDLKFNEKVLVNNKYFFELKLDYEKEKLFLFVYDLYGNLIERDAFINFDSLRSHLKIILSNKSLIFSLGILKTRFLFLCSPSRIPLLDTLQAIETLTIFSSNNLRKTSNDFNSYIIIL